MCYLIKIHIEFLGINAQEVICCRWYTSYWFGSKPRAFTLPLSTTLVSSVWSLSYVSCLIIIIGSSVRQYMNAIRTQVFLVVLVVALYYGLQVTLPACAGRVVFPSSSLFWSLTFTDCVHEYMSKAFLISMLSNWWPFDWLIAASHLSLLTTPEVNNNLQHIAGY